MQISYKQRIDEFKEELKNNIKEHERIQKDMIGDDGDISKLQDQIDQMKEEVELKLRIRQERIRVRLEDTLNESFEDNEYELSQHYDIQRQIQIDKFEKDLLSDLEKIQYESDIDHKSPNDQEIYQKALIHRYETKHQNLIKDRRSNLIADLENEKYRIKDDFTNRVQNLKVDEKTRM